MKRIAIKLGLVPFAALALALAAPAGAQNSTEPPAAATPPKAEPPASTTTAPPATTPPVTVEPIQPVIVQPVPAPAPPPPPMTIQPDVAYPNGFADPAAPFANDMALTYQQRESRPWGLLGLLGLLGLIPWIRGNGRVRTVYVERDDGEPRRVVRRERIEEE
jgi:cellulose synthase operon protein B